MSEVPGSPQLFDVTLPIAGWTPLFPGDPPVLLTEHASLARGDDYNLSHLSFGLHTGTHVDAPRHFIDGAPGIDALPLERLVGPAVVIVHWGVAPIRAADLRGLELGERVLFKTGNSAAWQGLLEAGRAGRAQAPPTDFVALHEDAARYLLAEGVRLVGIDGLSIDLYERTDYPVHRALLGAGVVIVEGLDLSSVEGGAYHLSCLPLKVVNADGAPARVVLMR